MSPSPPIVRRLVGLGRSIVVGDLPADAVAAAHHCVLDALGCAVAGSREPAVDKLLSVVGSGSGSTTLLGRSERLSILDAALVNGLATHALDYDDTHSLMSGHPTAPVLPAVLALAEREGASGTDVLTAFVVGVEAECRLGALVNPEHYRRGFHATATLGAIGAAAACARLLDLDEAAWANALGLAATQAAGLKSSFGTMAKPLHAGMAARAGLLAALLSAEGFVGAPEAVDGPQGLLDALGPGDIDAGALDDLDGRFLVRDTLFKYHAACYLTHSAIEAGRRLGARIASVDDIEGVDVRVPPSSLRVCNIENPATGLETKFSLRATTAMALLGEPTDALSSYADRLALEPRRLALRERVTIIAEPGVSATCTPVSVRLRDGRVEEQAVEVGEPASDLDDQGRRLRDKFRRLVAPVLGEDRAESLAKEIDALAAEPEATRLVRRLHREP